MGFQTPLYELAEYLKWTTSGHIQLPDFQRGYKWDDERIRQLLVTILRGHPLGVVMMLKTGNDQIRFKPRPLEGVSLPADTEPELLLLDGQQRLTSLTQALTGDGVVHTKDSRGILMDRRYYVHMATALLGEDRIDDAILSVPGDGVLRSNFGKDIDLDLSTPELERANGYFPVRLLFGGADIVTWLFACEDTDEASKFHAKVIQPCSTYNIPAIELDKTTSKAAVATVFEKVNTGGLPLNVFELLTATFAGDKKYFDTHGTDFRLNDDWHATQKGFAAHPVLAAVENTDFLQAVSLLATLKRAKGDISGRPPAVSARKEDLLKLSLDDYLEWVQPVRDAFAWTATFLADHHIFEAKFLPYPKQLVPLAAIKVVLGDDADLHGVRAKLAQWFWCGIIGELYGSTIETRFARDIEQVPDWACGAETTTPRTVADCTFAASRLLSLRTRNAAAYKGIYALVLSQGAKDWMYDKALDKVQYVALAVDIHHIFPSKWCLDHDIDPMERESIVNKTPLSAETNRAIGGVAPSAYLSKIEKKAGISPAQLDALVDTHLAHAAELRADNFKAFFNKRLEKLVALIEDATGKPVQNDIDEDNSSEVLQMFDPEDVAVVPDLEDLEV
ncbi:GmrSD restriction endonuclease domain-containing protein [Microbispora amethystogenes]|uniref:GmrSD restriction endonucleases N-terminal domain-containing protein n=1 Tax=Microbispora amethystogenes TaxID=1427754 RepID=A0ABQ4F8X7_9ACTN|nr:DUF262 domain-containing protein [Microbispora amethystogenes]GIH31281.1 hypothetical protein Mam01_14450 [Microbispora amethystogenes]